MARGRPLLIGLLIWALLMIVPDLARVVRPLSSFGFYADNNGMVYDTTGPFADKTASPAWRAGIREGDQLDLSLMRCLPFDRDRCASILTVVGGIQNVLPGSTIRLDLAAAPGQAARQVTIAAEPRTPNWLVRGVLFLDQIAGILVVLAAAWLVWARPGPDELGVLSLRHLVQSRPELRALRELATLAVAVAGAGRRQVACRRPPVMRACYSFVMRAPDR